MRTNVLAGVFSFLIAGVCCFGQAYTLQDPAFLGFLMSRGSGGIGIGCSPADTGLTSYFKLDEIGTGQWCADSATGNPNAASFSGSTWPVRVADAPIIIGRNPYSVTFPDTSGYINCGNDPKWLFVNNNYSISVWAKGPASPSDFSTIMKAASGTLYFRFCIRNRSGVLRYYFEDRSLIDLGGPGGGPIDGPTAASVGSANWVMWTITKQGLTWKMYKNAVEVATSTATGETVPAAGGFLIIGNDRDADGRNWTGNIAEARIYTNYGMGSNDVYCLYHNFYGQ